MSNAHETPPLGMSDEAAIRLMGTPQIFEKNPALDALLEADRKRVFIRQAAVAIFAASIDLNENVPGWKRRGEAMVAFDLAEILNAERERREVTP